MKLDVHCKQDMQSSCPFVWFSKVCLAVVKTITVVCLAVVTREVSTRERRLRYFWLRNKVLLQMYGLMPYTNDFPLRLL